MRNQGKIASYAEGMELPSRKEFMTEHNHEPFLRPVTKEAEEYMKTFTKSMPCEKHRIATRNLDDPVIREMLTDSYVVNYCNLCRYHYLTGWNEKETR